MPVQDNDWRLQGQERYLEGATLHRTRWKRPRPDWDHDHCAFCWAKLMEEESPGVLHEGYTTADRHWWVCEPCFEDFAGLFRWRVE